MRRLGVLLVVVVACGHGEGGGDEWDVREIQLAEALCGVCATVDHENCIVDVLSDMDSARIVVGPQGEAACLECMKVRTTVQNMVNANQCATSDALTDQVIAACDSDPTNDFDFDGDPANDITEACAGNPRSNPGQR